MYYHVTEGWGKRTSARNRVDKEELVEQGKAHGILVYCGREPVGWCQFGPPEELPRVDRKKGYTPGAGDAWRITCFFVDREHRRMGVAKEALNATLRSVQRKGAESVEAYPVLVGKGQTSSSFLWSGTSKLFESAGFKLIRRLGKSTAVYRIKLNT
jgi:GNAT superfamily N-acetyltransferase